MTSSNPPANPSPIPSATPNRPSSTPSSPNPDTSPTSPLVSIIIPVYNVAKVLERCIASVLAQTYQHLEIILIDDGSTDMSGRFCDLYANKDPRIKVIHQPNRGLSAARNAGLKIATGAYLTFVDSDDAIAPDYIMLLLSLCLDYHVKMSICGFKEVRTDSAAAAGPTILQHASPNSPATLAISNDPAPSATTASIAPTSSTTSAAPDSAHTMASAPSALAPSLLFTIDCLVAMLCEDGFSMSAWGKMYAADLWREIRFPERRLYEDVGTTYRLILQCPRIAVSSAKNYFYYRSAATITEQPFSLQKLDLITLTDEMCDRLISWARFQNPGIQQTIQNLTAKRRMHARFSILRQLIFVNQKSLPETPPEDDPAALTRSKFKEVQSSIITYLKTRKTDILKNPLASRRDRLALRALLLGGLPLFRFAWKLYSRS